MKQLFTAFFILSMLASASAQVLYQQDFEDGFQDMILINNDHKTPASALSTFVDAWNIRESDDGQAAISISWYTPAAASDDWMITPVISGITAKTILEWDARAVDPSYPDGYKVKISIGGTAIADFTDQVFSIGGEEATGVFKHRYIVLDDYVGKDIHVAFINNSNDQYVLIVDNIVVRTLPDVDASFVKLQSENYVHVGDDNFLHYTLKNEGFQTIDTVVINWTDGTGNFTETLTGLDLQFDEEYEGTLEHAFTAPNPEKYALDFSITANVGTLQDEVPDNNATTKTIFGVSTIVPKKVVAEEATGTWCQWCPRGAVYMELMKEQYPDLFIPIAVHNQDPMTVDEYDAGLTAFPQFPGFPSVVVDRREIIDPSDLESSIDALSQLIAPVAVDVQATIDSVQRKMYIQGKVTTYTNRAATKYNLVLVVAENDVHGTGSDYDQVNQYSGGGSGDMGGFEDLANPVPAAQMQYNFVGRELIHGFNGTTELIPTTIHVNDEYNFTATYTFPATFDMDQLYVVAMVTDGEAGDVLNAAKSEAVTSSIKDQIKELNALRIYPNPAHGTAYVDIELTEAATVTMELVNQLGQTVRSLDNGKMPAGHTVVPVQVTDLAAGVYLVKMNVAGKSLLRQLVIE